MAFLKIIDECSAMTIASASAMQAGGNMEGKEVRFGIANSLLWATVTTKRYTAVQTVGRRPTGASRAAPVAPPKNIS